MSRRHGILSMLRRRVKTGRGGREALSYLEGVLLHDPCVYCFQYGCNSLDHVTPYIYRDRLTPGSTIHGWMNLAPTHRGCNGKRGSRGVLWNLIGGQCVESCSSPEVKTRNIGELGEFKVYPFQEALTVSRTGPIEV